MAPLVDAASGGGPDNVFQGAGGPIKCKWVAVALEYAGGFDIERFDAGTRSADHRVVERWWEGMRVILVNDCELYIQRAPNGFPSHSEGGDVARCVGIQSWHPIIRR